MPRWNPDAETRLVAAAIDLFGERGYDAVTINDIAERAELTRRSFFRYFPDKREVLFAGSKERTPEISRLVRDVDPDVEPREVVMRALTEVGDYLTRDRAAQMRRQDLIDDSAELQERERTKLAAMAEALADGLIGRGLAAEDAHLLGVLAAEMFHSAYLRVIRDPPSTPFADRLRASLADATRLLVGGA